MKRAMAVSVAAILAAAASAMGADTAADQNKAVTRKFYEEVFNTGKIEQLDKYITADAVEHELLPGQKEPALVMDSVKMFITVYRKAFPDMKAEIKDMVAEGDKVVARVVVTGTHKDEFNGVAATGRSVSFEMIDIIRFANGKCVEHWGVSDDAGLMAQLTAPKPNK